MRLQVVGGLVAIAGCTSSGDSEVNLAGSWKLALGASSVNTCATNADENLGATLLTLTPGASSSSLNMEAALGNFWPLLQCPDFLALTVTDHIAEVYGEKCSWMFGAEGRGNWFVTDAPYIVTMELDAAQRTLTINGSQTISNTNNDGGMCTVTLTATATRL